MSHTALVGRKRPLVPLFTTPEADPSEPAQKRQKSSASQPAAVAGAALSNIAGQREPLAHAVNGLDPRQVVQIPPVPAQVASSSTSSSQAKAEQLFQAHVAQGRNGDAEELLEKGISMAKKGNKGAVLAAIQNLKSALDMSISPALRATILKNLGFIYAKRDEQDDKNLAIACFQEAAKIDHKEPFLQLTLLNNLGFMLLKRKRPGDIDHAIEAFGEGIRMDSPEKEYQVHMYCKLAEAYVARNQEGDEGRAVETLQSGIRSIPLVAGQVQLLHALSNLFDKRGGAENLNLAITYATLGAHLNNLHENNNLKAAVFNSLVALLTKRNLPFDTHVAPLFCRAVLELPNVENVHMAYAHTQLSVLIGQADLPTAIEHCQKALAMKHDDRGLRVKGQIHLAKLLIKRKAEGDIASAIVQLQYANQHALPPDFKAKVHFYFGEAYAERGQEGDLKSAIENYIFGLAQEQNDGQLKAQLFNCLGIAYIKQRDVSRAIANFQKGVALEHGDNELRAKLHYNIAMICIHRNQAEDLPLAISSLQKALQILGQQESPVKQACELKLNQLLNSQVAQRA